MERNQLKIAPVLQLENQWHSNDFQAEGAGALVKISFMPSSCKTRKQLSNKETKLTEFDVIWCYRPPSAAHIVFITQSDKGGRSLARDPGPIPGLRCIWHLRPPHLLLPPSMFATLEGLRPAPLQHSAPPTWQLKQRLYLSLINTLTWWSTYVYIHSLKHNLYNDT